jgi:predicted O-methyltransferase YrrM
MVAILDRAERALRFTRKRVQSTLAAPRTESRLAALERFEHPLAPRLARALRRVHERDHSTLLPWIWRIEQERAKLLSSREPLASIGPPGPYDAGLTVHDACLESRRLHDAVALYLIARELAPMRVLELGTNVGISSAYVAAALTDGTGDTLTTLEASPARAELAHRMHSELGFTNVKYVVGLFDDTLESALTEQPGEGAAAAPVDFVFIDGHHEYEPTLDYFDRIWKHSAEGALFVFDDIRWSGGMERAWRLLQQDPRLSVVVDLCGFGVGIGTRTPKAKGRLVTPLLSI